MVVITFVRGGFADPLNTIRHGAVVDQNAIQYMNFSKVDYVAVSRLQKTFILENGFFVDLEDAMTEVAQNGVTGWFDPAIAVTLVVIIAVFFASSFVIARRCRKRLQETEVPSFPSS